MLFVIVMLVFWSPVIIAIIGSYFWERTMGPAERKAFNEGKWLEYNESLKKKPTLLLNPAKRPTVDTEEYFDRYMPKA